LAAGKLIPQTGPDTVADGLLTSLGELTWPIIRDHVESIVTVDDPTILRSMRVFWERTKLIIEPSSATAVAVAMSEEVAALNPRRVGVILSGGNVNLDALGQYFSPRQ
jgi:threonine dehydratase/serine racemase